MDRATFFIKGMHCAACVRTVEEGVETLPGVSGCRVSFTTNSAAVDFDRNLVSEKGIIDKIRTLGYSARTEQGDVLELNRVLEREARRAFIISLIFSIPLMAVGLWTMIGKAPLYSPLVDGLAQGILAAVILFYGGRSILKDAAVQARHLRLNMNSLIALGTLVAWGWSVYALIRIYAGHGESLYFESAGMIITLILLGRWLEARVRRRVAKAIEGLLNLRPTMATSIVNGVEVEIAAADCQPGMVLLIKPGERIPADGEILEGQPVVDESVITGESFPVEKRPRQTVVGGSLNGAVPFRMTVTRVWEESFLATVIRLVSEAQSSKAPIQRLADRVAAVFVPVVLVLAVLTGVVWCLLAPESPMLIRSVIAVLVVACPCALGLATPAAVLAGTGRGAREGIIVKGGEVLEALSHIDTVVFDKTGTLTKGMLEVVNVQTFGQVSEQNLVRMVGSVESYSEHPVGQAIVRHMKSRQISSTVVKNVEARPGYGMVAECDRRRLLIGNRALMETEKVSFGPSLLLGERDMERGRTVVFAAMDGQVVGLIALADQIKGDARELLQILRQRMPRVTMVSGDNRKTALGVARSLGLDSVEAEVQPGQKKVIIESLRRAGFKVAMVGDGINDAPALAAADVGIAISGGTDLAVQTAGVVLIRTELAAVERMFSLADQTMKTIRQNLFWAFFYNILAIPIAAGLFYPLLGLSLSPVLAALAMSLSSVFVVSNSLRLNSVEL